MAKPISCSSSLCDRSQGKASDLPVALERPVPEVRGASAARSNTSGSSPKAKPRLSRRGPARLVPSGGRPRQCTVTTCRARRRSLGAISNILRADHGAPRCLGACIEAIVALHEARRLGALNVSRSKKINVRSWNSALSSHGRLARELASA